MAGGAAVAPPLPPLPLTSKKESQAYQRELHTVTVGAPRRRSRTASALRAASAAASVHWYRAPAFPEQLVYIEYGASASALARARPRTVAVRAWLCRRCRPACARAALQGTGAAGGESAAGVPSRVTSLP